MGRVKSTVIMQVVLIDRAERLKDITVGIYKYSSVILNYTVVFTVPYFLFVTKPHL